MGSIENSLHFDGGDSLRLQSCWNGAARRLTTRGDPRGVTSRVDGSRPSCLVPLWNSAGFVRCCLTRIITVSRRRNLGNVGSWASWLAACIHGSLLGEVRDGEEVREKRVGIGVRRIEKTPRLWQPVIPAVPLASRTKLDASEKRLRNRKCRREKDSDRAEALPSTLPSQAGPKSRTLRRQRPRGWPGAARDVQVLTAEYSLHGILLLKGPPDKPVHSDSMIS